MRAKIPIVHEAGITLLGFAFSLFLFLSSSSGDSSAPLATQAHPEGLNPGPDVIAGDLSSLQQFGSDGTEVGLAMGTDTCNSGDQELNFFAMPNTDHPVLAQSLYRMSHGAANNERFEQIGQSWGAHGFFALQSNGCSFGCTPASDGTHLGAGCSTADTASINSGPFNLGSRAWLNPFTGLFPSTANDHAGHTHTGTSHRILVNGSDLDTTMNPGATYYAEAQYVTPHEYAWCQAHPGQCNMNNNASYRQFSVAGTTNFTFSPIGSTVRMTPAINAWPGATIRTIEPAPGVDGRAFLAYKVTGPVAGLYHYEYAIYNQNLDRGIRSFSVPRLLIPDISGAELGGEQNVGFHAPPQHPGFPADGTQGNAGFSSAEWTFDPSVTSLTWNSETFAQNPNANAIRWGTLYNFRFDSTTPPVASDATVGFFKTGAPITVAIEGPAPIGGPLRMISGTVVYCSNPSLDPVPGVTLTLTGDAGGSTLSDGSGYYQFLSLPSGGSYTVTPSKAARLPGSAGIDTVDVVATQRHFLMIGTPLSGCRLTGADVNGDTLINTIDIVAMQRFFLGGSTGIANVGKYQFTPANRTYPGMVSDQIAQNYDTLVFGDVASGFVHRPEGQSQDMSAGEVPATVATLSLPNVAVDAFVTNFIVQVTTTVIDAKNKLVGFQGDFTFDERMVTFQSQPVQKAGITGGNWNVSGNVLAGPGPIRTLRISAYSNDFTALSGSGTLFELRMTRVSQVAQGTQLLWAAPPDHFIFIDADLNTQKPGSAAPGSVTPSGKRK